MSAMVPAIGIDIAELRTRALETHYAGGPTPEVLRWLGHALTGPGAVRLILTVDRHPAAMVVPIGPASGPEGGAGCWHLSVSHPEEDSVKPVSDVELEAWATAVFGSATFKLAWQGRRRDSSVRHIVVACDAKGRHLSGTPVPGAAAELALTPYQPPSVTMDAYGARDLPDLRLRMLDDWRAGGPLERAFPDRVASWARRVAAHAALWWVSPEMTDLCCSAALTLPGDTTLTPEMVPDPAGLVVFGRRVDGIDKHSAEHSVTMDGYLWGPAVMYDREGMNVLAMLPLSRLFGMTGLYPVGHSDWPLGWRVDRCYEEGTSPTEFASIEEDRRRLATLWLLTAQPGVAFQHPEPLPRQTVRRSQRHSADPTVRVIQLRHARAEHGNGAGTSTRTYRHRWLVSAHWRQQAYGPAHSLRKPILINPYTKGPEGAPLLDTEKVKAWTR